MSHSYSIDVENLGKRYRLGVIGRKTLAEEMRYLWCKTTGRDPGAVLGPVTRKPAGEMPGRLMSQLDPDLPGTFWSIRNVSFTLQPGEIVGVVGANGAGKSTLLKILSRITEPTEGRARIRGRMSSLLEVGTGFNPELTGRENVFVNSAILGMNEEETREKFDAIVDFSEISDFIDTPVKRYSSGMRTRLAFAVAAHIEPEVLLLDEVLSVGDASFQAKCAAKMQDLAGQGRTVLIVSHRFSTLSEMCSRCLWLDRGKLVSNDKTDVVLNHYLSETSAEGGAKEWKKGLQRPLLPEFNLYSLRIRNVHGDITAAWPECEPITVEIEYELEHDVPGFSLGIGLTTDKGQPISDAYPETDEDINRKGRHCITATIPGMSLTPGPLLVSVLVRVPKRMDSVDFGKPLKSEILASTDSILHRGRARLPIEWEQRPAAVPQA